MKSACQGAQREAYGDASDARHLRCVCQLATGAETVLRTAAETHIRVGQTAKDLDVIVDHAARLDLHALRCHFGNVERFECETP